MLLFAAGAAFTAWRNSEVGVLVDIAYPLNTATRIALGEVPYAQFPLVLAPLHFLVQAGLIKLFGPHFAVQIAYASILSGLSAWLTYRLTLRILRGTSRSALVAAFLGIAAIPVGIYSIYPHPFYDPDTCFLVLLGLTAIFASFDRPTKSRWIAAGALLTLPIWTKQTIGGAFLVSALGVLSLNAVVQPSARAWLRWCTAGIAVAFALEVATLQFTVGIDHYVGWTWSFALSGRGVSADRIAPFVDPRVLWPATLILVPAALSKRLTPGWRTAAFAVALCFPAIAAAVLPAAALATPELFPPLLVSATVLAVAASAALGPSFERLLPFVLTGTALGALMSQGLPSSYGIFPLLIMAIASLVRDLGQAVPLPVRLAPMTGIVLALLILVSGSFYTLTNDRLRFIDVNAPGPVHSSTFPSLVGLSARGPYIADLDEILVWTHDHVQPDEPMVYLPGEDPVFFALQRRPALPSVYFYDVANPYTPAELARIADEVGLRWVFVKDRLQITEEPPLEPALIASLTRGADLVARVGAYRIYRRP